MTEAGIYRIVVNRPNGTMFYIGQAVNLSDRRSHHLRFLRRGRHKNARLQRAFTKYGESAFSFETLLICEPSKATLTMYEQAVLDSYPEAAVFNISRLCVESRLGVKASEQTRARMRVSATGIVHSDATIQRISATKRAQGATPAMLVHIRRLAARNTGQPRSPETREAIRRSKLGKKKPPEEIARRQATRAANRELR